MMYKFALTLAISLTSACFSYACDYNNFSMVQAYAQPVQVQQYAVQPIQQVQQQYAVQQVQRVQQVQQYAVAQPVMQQYSVAVQAPFVQVQKVRAVAAVNQYAVQPVQVQQVNAYGSAPSTTIIREENKSRRSGILGRILGRKNKQETKTTIIQR